MEVEGTQTQRQTKNNKIKGFEAFQSEVRIDWNILQLDLFTYITHLTTLLDLSLSLRSILCRDTQVLKPKTNPIFP